MNIPNRLLQKNYLLLSLFIICLILIPIFKIYFPTSKKDNETSIVKVKKQSFDVEVKMIGELEAANSLSISSLLKGENAKIISIIPDGTSVRTGDLLIKIDSTPFEEKLENLKSKYKEQDAYVAALQKSLDWEIGQAERDDKTAAFEIELAELELNKVLYGDGPQEIARLKGAMHKVLLKYEEVQGYASDLQHLEEEGFLNPSEIKNAQKTLEDEKEAYESAKLQYDSYVTHVFPMHVKRAEAGLKQAKMRKEETIKIRGHAIGKAMVELNQATQVREGIKIQIQEAEKELALTEIKAPSPGMVVLKEDFRNGQRRRARLGDVVLKNQVILDLPDMSRMTVKSKIREIDLYKIDLGKEAQIEIDAYPQLHFTGKVVAIGSLALPDPGKPTEEKYFEIRILLDHSHAKIRPGMTSRVIIRGDRIEDVLAIPIHALFYEQEKAYCFVPFLQGYEKREVVPGISNMDWVEIHEGLAEGENVCLTPPVTQS